ncbi:MAG: cysteine desulfurase [Candidatus Zixiibacteriota bacterium]
MKAETNNKPVAAVTQSTGLDIEKIKADFPILRERINGNRLVYLDSAATAQKPQAAIDAHAAYYRKLNANIHRGLHTLAEQATAAFELTRAHVARFIGGVQTEEVIMTKGATESINLVAYTWGEKYIGEGDEIIITEMEHHANFVPWIMLAERKKAIIKRLPITVCGHLDLSDFEKLLTPRTKLLALCHASNVLGTINPIKDLAAKAHQHGVTVLADGAQAAPHMPVDVKDLGVDFYVFSAHKMLGPTGVGVLYGRRELLETMPPFNFGGEMIREVSFERVTFNDLPWRFEAGTPNIGGVVAFDAALSYLEEIGMDRIRWHEMSLAKYAIERLLEIPGIEIQGPREIENRGGAISFSDPNIHPHDISTFLDSRGIAIRAGHHCAQPLMRALGKVATARASLYIYNDEADIDVLCEALRAMRKYFGV